MTPRNPDPDFEAWIARAKDAPISEGLACLGWGAKEMRAKAGPCPACGGRDRFWINPGKDAWGCRHCGTGGKGALSLLMHVPGARFLDVCADLAGPSPKRLAAETAEDRAARQRQREEAQMRREDDARQRRERQRLEDLRQSKRALKLWQGAQPVADGDAVSLYWRLRGLTCAVPADIRLHTRMAYWAGMASGEAEVVWRGPAMVSAARDAGGEITGCHITWLHPALADGHIDPARATKGKAAIVHPETGEIMPAKKMRGQTWGSAIWLTERRDFMLAGEGIETTGAALSAFGGHPRVGAAVGMSLGHLAAVPVAAGAAWMFLGDGDSDPAATRAALQKACASALKAGAARALIAMAPQGCDLNDLVMA